MKKSFKKNMMKSGFITLTAMLGDKRFCFLIDTGSNQNCVTQAAYKEVFDIAKEVSRIDIYGVDGKPQEELLIELPYKCGRIESRDLFFVMSGNPFDAVSDQYGVNLSGILGFSFLKRHKAKIDYETMELILL